MKRLSVLLAATAVAALGIGVTTQVTVAPSASEAAPTRTVGYFTGWSMYDAPAYWVKDVQTSGTAAKLTHLNYAFANVNQQGKCYAITKTGEGDAYADYQNPVLAGDAVDGQADATDQPLAGHFNQLKKLKAKNPNLRVNMSIGGWTWSKYFSNAALTDASRKAFAQSCIDLYIKGNLPKLDGMDQGGPGVGAGIFDGFDLDWEWPAAEGNTGNVIRPEDKANYVLLVQELRKQLDAIGQTTGKRYEITTFAPADAAKIDAGWDVPKLNGLFDYFNIQGYDLHGDWDKTTNHQSAIKAPAGDPSPQKWSIDQTVQDWIKRGADKSKLVVGLPFYGRGWTGVPAGPSGNGLFQTSTACANIPGSTECGYGNYKLLKPLLNQGYKLYRDEQAGFAWLYNGTNFITYDDPTEIKRKAAYIKAQGLGGGMIWSLDGDTTTGELITALQSGLS
ncbi:glycoside hydrolase family 18 protein [Pseudonocardiaceae bacterium YIM PH 21723]|nr:glycoside hydrolase family 18 protein [Pseudonocardiaceae bacterium YIM PH 21723]